MDAAHHVKNGEYRETAEHYFDWLVEELNRCSQGNGWRMLASEYNTWAFSGGRTPMNLPAGTSLDDFIQQEIASKGYTLTGKDRGELYLEVDAVLKGRIEGELHERNHANP